MRVLCTLCATTAVFRRTLCRSCYRKLEVTSKPIPTKAGRKPTSLEDRVRRWDSVTRQRVLDALKRVQGIRT